MRVFQFENLAADVNRDLLGKIAVGDGRCNFRNVSDLAGQVAGHQVHVVGQVLPRARHALNFGLSAELSFRTHFASHACHFRCE